MRSGSAVGRHGRNESAAGGDPKSYRYLLRTQHVLRHVARRFSHPRLVTPPKAWRDRPRNARSRFDSVLTFRSRANNYSGILMQREFDLHQKVVKLFSQTK